MTLNIVIPMAGKGSRFASAGYDLPKPLIPVFNRPLIAVSFENMAEGVSPRVVFVYADEDARHHPDLPVVLKYLHRDATLIGLQERPKNPMDSLLAGVSSLSGDAAVLALNCDQHVALPGSELLRRFNECGADVAAFTMMASGSEYARIELDDAGRVSRLLGKTKDANKPALTGLYMYKTPALATSLAKSALAADAQGEVCISESLRIALGRKLAVAALSLGHEGEICSILGTPSELENFINKTN